MTCSTGGWPRPAHSWPPCRRSSGVAPEGANSGRTGPDVADEVAPEGAGGSGHEDTRRSSTVNTRTNDEGRQTWTLNCWLSRTVRTPQPPPPCSAKLSTTSELRDVVYRTTTITTDEQAAERGFAGSPSFHVDGTDLFPLPGNPTALACRLYPTASGRAGTPDLADLRSALARGDNTPQG